MSVTSNQTRWKPIPTGSAKVGMKIVCPDGHGEVIYVYDQDNVRIRLGKKRSDGKDQLAVYDLSRCCLPDDPGVSEVLK